MKTQRHFFDNTLKVVFSLFIFLVCTLPQLQAQTPLSKLKFTNNGALQDDGFERVKSYAESYTGNHPYIDAIIPNDAAGKELLLTATGASGGKATKTAFPVYGGGGAEIKAAFEIGNGSKQLKPGSTIRFIIGEAGHSSDFAGGGGGGTGIVYQEVGTSNWEVLVVAGGGGGGIRYSISAFNHANGGLGANTEEAGDNGKNGKNNGSQGGENGHRGENGGGGLYYGDFQANQYTGDLGIQNGQPTGGLGGYQDHFPGGFGFGGGGGGRKDSNDGFGGGGGGYSGGGRGGRRAGGGGGGSFVNSMAITSFKRTGIDGGMDDHDKDYGFEYKNGSVSYVLADQLTPQITNIEFTYPTGSSPATKVKVSANTPGQLKWISSIPQMTSTIDNDEFKFKFPGNYAVNFYSNEVSANMFSDPFTFIVGANNNAIKAFAVNNQVKVSNKTATVEAFSQEALSYKLYKSGTSSQMPLKQNTTGVFSNLDSGNYMVIISFKDFTSPYMANIPITVP